ncbi:hypothetical protein ACX3V1_11510, partial [Escherichia coli]
MMMNAFFPAMALIVLVGCSTPVSYTHLRAHETS